MSFFEWLFERHNPGPTGTIEQHTKRSTGQPPAQVILFIILALVVLAIPFYLAGFPFNFQQNAGLYAGILVGEIIYLLLSYFINAQPDTSNIGWMGGLIDNPFRISDDINRLLIFLKIILWPDRFISVAILNFINLLKKGSYKPISNE